MDKSIDEKLEEANRQFDERLKAEAKAKGEPVVGEAVEVAPNIRVTKKTEKKRVLPKSQRHKVGEVSCWHPYEDDYEIVEKACHYVEHTVRDRKGFELNGKRYQGKVIVPQCVADYLQMMENRHKSMERGIFEDRGRTIVAGTVRG